MSENSFIATIKYLDFRKLWLAQVFSQIALNILTYAIVLHIYDITNSATAISLVMIFSAIPVAFFGPFSGVFADKFNYRKILILTNGLRFLAALLLILSRNNILGLLEVVFLISAISQFFTPAESSSFPLVVPQNCLVSANSMSMTTSYATLLFGYAIAGPLLFWIGLEWLFILCSILFLIATYCTFSMSKFDKKEPRNVSLANIALGVERVWTEAKSGIEYLKNEKGLLNPMIKLTIGWTVVGAFITLLPLFGESVLKIDPKLIGPIIIAPAGVGMVLSANFLSRLKSHNYHKMMTIGCLVFSVSLAIFSLYQFYGQLTIAKLVMILLVLGLGFGSGLTQISAQTLLHLRSSEEKRGRVFGISSMQIRLASSLPSLAVAAVADWTSPARTMMLIAAVFLIYSFRLLFD